MKKIKIGYSTTILADDSTLSKIASLLFLATDERGDCLGFSIEAADLPERLKQAAQNEELVKAEMERQGKSWLAQYQRAQELQKQLDAIKSSAGDAQ